MKAEIEALWVKVLKEHKKMGEGKTTGYLEAYARFASRLSTFFHKGAWVLAFVEGRWRLGEVNANAYSMGGQIPVRLYRPLYLNTANKPLVMVHWKRVESLRFTSKTIFTEILNENGRLVCKYFLVKTDPKIAGKKCSTNPVLTRVFCRMAGRMGYDITQRVYQTLFNVHGRFDLPTLDGVGFHFDKGEVSSFVPHYVSEW